MVNAEPSVVWKIRVREIAATEHSVTKQALYH